MRERVLNYLGLMRKAGKIETGEINAGTAVKSGRARLLLLAPDAGENAKHRADNFCNGRKVVLVVPPFQKDEISHYVGKANTVLAAVTDMGFAAAFMKALAEYDSGYEEAYGRLMELDNRATGGGKTGTRRNDV